MEKQQTNTPSPTQPLLQPPSYPSPVYPPNNNVGYNNNNYNNNYYNNSNYYGQPIVTQCCAFHPQFQAFQKCHSCSRLLCLQCAVEVRTRRWVSHIFCPACAIKARSTRLIVWLISFVIFLVLAGVIIATIRVL